MSHKLEYLPQLPNEIRQLEEKGEQKLNFVQQVTNASLVHIPFDFSCLAHQAYLPTQAAAHYLPLP